MNKVKIFHEEYCWKLEEKINEFALKYNILNTSICTEKHGYDVYYTVIIVYEEKPDAENYEETSL